MALPACAEWRARRHTRPRKQGQHCFRRTRSSAFPSTISEAQSHERRRTVEMDARAAFPGFLVRLQVQIVGVVFERESGVLPWVVFDANRAVDQMTGECAARFAHA